MDRSLLSHRDGPAPCTSTQNCLGGGKARPGRARCRTGQRRGASEPQAGAPQRPTVVSAGLATAPSPVGTRPESKEPDAWTQTEGTVVPRAEHLLSIPFPSNTSCIHPSILPTCSNCQLCPRCSRHSRGPWGEAGRNPALGKRPLPWRTRDSFKMRPHTRAGARLSPTSGSPGRPAGSPPSPYSLLAGVLTR